MAWARQSGRRGKSRDARSPSATFPRQTVGENKMKRGLVPGGAVLMGLVVSLAFLGVGYGLFADTLRINGAVSTGSVNAAFSLHETDEGLLRGAPNGPSDNDRNEDLEAGGIDTAECYVRIYNPIAAADDAGPRRRGAHRRSADQRPAVRLHVRRPEERLPQLQLLRRLRRPQRRQHPDQGQQARHRPRSSAPVSSTSPLRSATRTAPRLSPARRCSAPCTSRLGARPGRTPSIASARRSAPISGTPPPCQVRHPNRHRGDPSRPRNRAAARERLPTSPQRPEQPPGGRDKPRPSRL